MALTKFQPSGWASSRGLGDLEMRIATGQSTPEDYAWLAQRASAPSGHILDAWNDYVSRVQHQESGDDSGLFGTGISTGIPVLDNVASMLGTNSVGGMTGYNAATGGDIGQGVMLDLAGLAAGYGIAGLGAPASASAGGTAAGTGGSAAAAGGGEATLGGGLNFNSAGASGITSGTTGAGGLHMVAPGGTPFAQGYFAAETLVPVAGAGGLAGGAAAGQTAAQGGIYGPSSSATGTAATPATAAATAGTTAPAISLPSFMTNPSVLGTVGGALLGSGLLGGGTEAHKIETEEGLPDWLQAYMRPTLDRYSAEMQNHDTDPYGVMPAAMSEFKNTVSGLYLDPSSNKYLEDYFRAGSERIRSNLSPSFGHMQSFGQHSGYNEALSRGLGDFATGLYGGAYDKERTRQTELTAAAPSFLTQNSLAKFAPYNQYLSTLGSLGKKKEEPYYTNTFSNMLGGGMLGYGLGRAFT